MPAICDAHQGAGELKNGQILWLVNHHRFIDQFVALKRAGFCSTVQFVLKRTLKCLTRELRKPKLVHRGFVERATCLLA